MSLCFAFAVSGKVPKDHDLERQISSLCNRLPTISGQAFEEEFMTVCSFTIFSAALGIVVWVNDVFVRA